MGEAKPTPGPWLTHREGFSTIYIQASIGGGWVQEIAACGPTNEGGAQQEANARLIADAGTVFNTTGLTPSQLVERVKELEEAAKLVLDWYEAENDHSKTDFYQRMQMCRDSEDAIRAALSKARPNTAEGE